MPIPFRLDEQDYKLLERAVLARFERVQGRYHAAYFFQVFAWMFVTLAVFTFFKLKDQTQSSVADFGFVLAFAVIGFLFASARPFMGQRLYQRYVASSNQAFMMQQSVEVKNGALVLQSASGTSTVPRLAIIDHSQDPKNTYLFITGVQAITLPAAVVVALGADFAEFLAARQ